MSILGRVHGAFFKHYQFDAMTYMSDEIVLARMMMALYLEFEKAQHYHDEGYESDNDHGIPAQVMRAVHIYSVLTTEASFDLANYKETQYTTSSFTPR